MLVLSTITTLGLFEKTRSYVQHKVEIQIEKEMPFNPGSIGRNSVIEIKISQINQRSYLPMHLVNDVRVILFLLLKSLFSNLNNDSKYNYINSNLAAGGASDGARCCKGQPGAALSIHSHPTNLNLLPEINKKIRFKFLGNILHG